MFCFEKEISIPIYKQLYDQIRQQIMEGVLSKDEKLTPTRELAAEYHISRNTVIQAYRQLEAEGYVRSVTGSGYFVEDLKFFQDCCQKEQPEQTIPKNVSKREKLYDFNYGDLDYNCYCSKAWRQNVIEAYDRIAAQKTAAYGDPQGLAELRCALVKYLQLSRGVQCSEEQIVITSGHRQSLTLLCELFSGENRYFAMEDPGYTGTRIAMQHNGYSIIPVPVERDGISVAGAERLSNALLYITPSHQFPMGSVLPITKRLALLQWAVKTDSYILEDDYDSELRYHSLPIPSLQSIDNGDRTIYMGTFSKSLSPDLRIAYLVLPKRLLNVCQSAFAQANCTASALLQYALAQFIRSGEYQKHINAMRTYYRRKHDYIREYVKENLSDKAKLIGEDSGLHFILEVQNAVGDTDLIKELAKRKIIIYPTSQFWFDSKMCPSNHFLLGFGSLPLTELPLAMSVIGDTIRQLS